MLRIVLFSLALAITACTAVPGSRPNKFNYPPTYLETVPLNISEEEAINKMGPPDEILEVGGKKRLVYRPNAKATMSYNFIIENGVVVDVIYNESGSLNGKSARTIQKK